MSTTLHDYQREGLDELLSLYRGGHHRLTLNLPCGTGKTVLAAHLIPAMDARLTVVFVPTVHLLSQTLHRLVVDNPHAAVLAVCSPTALDTDDLPEVATARAIDQPVTTDAASIARTLLSTERQLIVAATYASSGAVAEATHTTNTVWDLLICDEAHRTAGTHEKAWALPLNDRQLPARKRLFMTATTRVITLDTDNLPEGVDSADIHVASMDSVVDYGPHVTPLTFRDAITRDYLSDYEIAVVAVAHDDVITALRASHINKPSPSEISGAAAQLALLHTASTDPHLRSVLAFHNRIDQSRSWTAQLGHLAKTSDPGVHVQNFHVDGATASSWRTRAINALANPGESLTVVSNCKVFAEGVDVPALDAVMFAAPRSSGPDIVQIIGRAIRTHPDGSRKALIILPVLDYDDDSIDLDTKVARTGHLAAWQVLTALAEQDEILHDSLLQWREHIQHAAPAPENSPLRIDTSMLAVGAHLPFTLRAISRASSPYVLTAAKLKDFHAKYGHTRPRSGQLFDGYPLAQRCSSARAAYKAHRLHPRIVALFDLVPGWEWTTKTATHQRTPDEWIALVEHFVAKTGIRTVHRAAWVTAPDTGARANIGEWLHTKARRKNYLTPAEQGRLTSALNA
ncbi:DEAD/DEAH box helicase family protein [Rhodococcus baikonurensis]|uniref:DEAD/DEAH box helicase family protein n=1 Tax=Rhodococcus baikonurensis TaxID=172041 RepID=A0ABV5XB07_9NOCA